MTDDELDQHVRASILAEEVDTSRVELVVRKQIRNRRRIRGGVFVAAAASIALGFFFRPQIPPICVAAAQDHEREIVNGEPRRWVKDAGAIDSLAEKQGVAAAAIAALGTTGYRLERGRLCFLKRQIYLHLVYSKDGDVFSVYLRPRGSEPLGDSVHQTEVGPERLAYFQSDRLTAVFVAHQSGADVSAFARAGLHSLTIVDL